MWTQGGREPWSDLTGLDPGCWESAQFPDCHMLYSREEEDDPHLGGGLAEWVAEQFERPGGETAIDEVLHSVPLNQKIVRALMPVYDPDFAIREAMSRAYPVDSAMVIE